MAEENQDGQEKTEEPSQRKIDKHKEDGKDLRSKEMFVFTGIAGALLLMYASSFAFKPLLFEWGNLFVFTGNDKLDDLPCLLYTSPSPRDRIASRIPSSA